jgi:SAM-dependent methyltransferase
MLQDAQKRLRDSQYGFRFMTLDAQEVPFGDESFDAVIANHMLYHVPDISKAISEVHRVLKPGGRFYAATNGSAHMRELRELAGKSRPDIPISVSDRSFILESGTALLSQCFAEVKLRRYEDSLAVTEAAPLIAYVLSISGIENVPVDDRAAELTRFVEQELASHGVINITKDVGIFIARRSTQNL